MSKKKLVELKPDVYEWVREQAFLQRRPMLVLVDEVLREKMVL